MVAAGLKPGDRFTDGGREFEVLEVVALGYISKRAEPKPEVKTPREKKPAGKAVRKTGR